LLQTEHLTDGDYCTVMGKLTDACPSEKDCNCPPRI